MKKKLFGNNPGLKNQKTEKIVKLVLKTGSEI